jgi:hypothetical protein
MTDKKRKYRAELEVLNLEDFLTHLRKEESKRPRRSSLSAQEPSSTREVIQRLIERVQRV